MQYLFNVWQSLAVAVWSADHILLVSDYDGTLTPIVNRPEAAVLSPPVRSKLETLANYPGFSVGVISGRSLVELRAMVGIEGIYYAGNHGLEIAGPGLDFTSTEAEKARSVISRLAADLRAGLGRIQGILVEDKGLSLSVHYRLAARGEIKTAEAVFRRVTAPLLEAGKIKVTAGKKVWEVRPPLDWHKGKAVEVIIDEIKARLKPNRLLVIYLGDDATDEDVFRMLRPPQGWGVFIRGERVSSGAEYFLNNAADVEELLSRLPALRSRA